MFTLTDTHDRQYFSSKVVLAAGALVNTELLLTMIFKTSATPCDATLSDHVLVDFGRISLSELVKRGFISRVFPLIPIFRVLSCFVQTILSILKLFLISEFPAQIPLYLNVF